MSNKIIMIGPFPPPIGGVSVHLSRLVNIFEKKQEVIKIDTARNLIIQLLKLILHLGSTLISSKQYIVHSHISRININFLIVLSCKLLRIKYVQTFHSFRIDYDKLNRFNKMILKYTIENSSIIIAVNESISNIIKKISVQKADDIIILPAFLPYKSEYSNDELQDYIHLLGVDDFIKSHKYIICANAYKIKFYNGEDLYGIDLCIELTRLLNDYKKGEYGFIFMLPQIGDGKYFEILNQNIKKYGIESNFIFVNKEVDLVPLFKYVDVFIRPTNTDGDALSIREALYEGVPTIASNAVTRPSGTIVFDNRNYNDLYEKVIETTEDPITVKLNIKKHQDNQKELLAEYDYIYHRIL